ncbi:Uncharacterised protein [Serratia liquefaciens]|nr:Uncharacterised protein [Serratia liquefaciens]
MGSKAKLFKPAAQNRQHVYFISLTGRYVVARWSGQWKQPETLNRRRLLKSMLHRISSILNRYADQLNLNVNKINFNYGVNPQGRAYA